MAGRREQEKLTEWVRQAADGLATSTDPPGRNRELEELRLHLARLQERLVVSLEQASRFTGDAAHELRFPLTAMQVKVDRLIQPSAPASEVQKDLADIADDIHRLSGLVRRLFWLVPCTESRSLAESKPSLSRKTSSTFSISAMRTLGSLQEPASEAEARPGVRDRARLRQILNSSGNQ